MFTKINKAVLWLFIIAGIIISIAVGSSGDGKMAWFIPVGIVATLIISASMGMMVEISENIKESCDHLYELKNSLNVSSNKNSASPQQSHTSNYGAPAPNGNKDYGNALSKFSAINNGGEASSVPDFWYCTQCGTKNDRLASTCKGCGKYK